MNLLKQNLELAVRLRDMKPWEFMFESDTFGVQMPVTGHKYFISIMGSDNVHRALSAYDGVEALHAFLEMRDEDTWMRAGDLLLIPQLMVSFEDEELLEPAEIEKYAGLGFQFSEEGSCPMFRKYIPGFMPVEPAEPDMEALKIILEQSIDVIERARNNPEVIFHDAMLDDEFMVRVQTEASQGEWKDTVWALEYPDKELKFDMPRALPGKVAGLPKNNAVYQVDMALLNQVIQGPGEPARFGMLFLVADKKDGIMLDAQVLDTIHGIPAVYDQFPALLLNALLKLKHQPAFIEIRHPLLLEMANRVLFPAKTKVRMANHLEIIDDFLESIGDMEM
ncbi:MAG: DUF7309 domain-containing protein [Bacteroidota bacterium]